MKTFPHPTFTIVVFIFSYWSLFSLTIGHMVICVLIHHILYHMLSMLEIMLLIMCIYSHERWIRNATTIICYTPLLEDCSTIISFRWSPTFILHTRRNRIKLQSHRTETGTFTTTEHHLYPRLHAQPMTAHIFDTLRKFWSNLGSDSGKRILQLLSGKNWGARLCMRW